MSTLRRARSRHLQQQQRGCQQQQGRRQQWRQQMQSSSRRQHFCRLRWWREVGGSGGSGAGGGSSSICSRWPKQSTRQGPGGRHQQAHSCSTSCTWRARGTPTPQQLQAHRPTPMGLSQQQHLLCQQWPVQVLLEVQPQPHQLQVPLLGHQAGSGAALRQPQATAQAVGEGRVARRQPGAGGGRPARVSSPGAMATAQ